MVHAGPAERARERQVHGEMQSWDFTWPWRDGASLPMGLALFAGLFNGETLACLPVSPPLS